ncbi:MULTISPECIES: hypothetical protein [unclassified Mesorhizobium]|uniref:hypothetical protein n=1 Tax=unclassified Mesorhizobium TaxID=325217 RepID=UPI000FCA0214|nr:MULTISPECIES: hypothetical protein [unclassified Mesorhizobium]RUV17885.1 hypothetical protein EOA91_18760 [Mesorhizobium sp. M1A.F.Ca.IN.022.04.1.1]RWG27089.1 MAG: hypothetical protein EOQ60_26210 [Mesorhizobium sp.]
MKVKRAETIAFFLCDECSAVHIGLWRNGQMFAEAIPLDPDAVVADLQATIAESKARQGITNTPVIGHTH